MKEARVSRQLIEGAGRGGAAECNRICLHANNDSAKELQQSEQTSKRWGGSQAAQDDNEVQSADTLSMKLSSVPSASKRRSKVRSKAEGRGRLYAT